jgi:hypothetical protein
MALFGVANGVRWSMRVTSVAVGAVSVVVEEEETDDIRYEAKTTDDENETRLADFLRFHKPLNCLKKNRET